ncbi:porin [Serratia ureilytica]
MDAGAEIRSGQPLPGGQLCAHRKHDLCRRRSLRRLRPRADAVEAVAQYHFDSGVTPSVAYLQTRGRNLPGIGDADLVKYLDLALNYSFNANMSTYVEYKLNLLQRQNAVGAGADDIVETGIMYQF